MANPRTPTLENINQQVIQIVNDWKNKPLANSYIIALLSYLINKLNTRFDTYYKTKILYDNLWQETALKEYIHQQPNAEIKTHLLTALVNNINLIKENTANQANIDLKISEAKLMLQDREFTEAKQSYAVAARNEALYQERKQAVFAHGHVPLAGSPTNGKKQMREAAEKIYALYQNGFIPAKQWLDQHPYECRVIESTNKPANEFPVSVVARLN